jgi:hypothetical protein
MSMKERRVFGCTSFVPWFSCSVMALAIAIRLFVYWLVE